MIQGVIKTEKQYRATEMDSSSSLKEFSLDRRKYYKKYIKLEKVTDEEDSKASVVGRVVETLLFEPEQFDNRFYMSSLVSAPTGLMLAFVEALYKYTKEATDEDGNVSKDFEELSKLAYSESGFKIKLEAVLGKFEGSDAEIYYKEIREVRSKGLTVVTTDDITNAERIVEELKTNEFTKDVLSLMDSDRYSIYKQLQVEGYEIGGLKLKSMMDVVIVDHEKKTIQPYDLKCTWSVEGFYNEYYLYRRAYIQAYLYFWAAKEFAKKNGLEDYRVEYIKFIVCDSINYYNPLIYTLTNDDMDDAYNGFKHKNTDYPGVKGIIMDLRWAKENDRWNISRKNFLNNGRLNIKG